MAGTNTIRFTLIRLCTALITGVLGLAAVVAALFSHPIATRISHLWGRLILRTLRVPVIVNGLPNLDPSQQYVIMCNHESMLDIPTLLATLPRSLELRFLAKKSLFHVPFLGWAMRALRFIPVNRDDRSTATAMLKKTLDEIKRGGSPLVFPEQTWTLDGRLLPFQRGGFLIALRSALPILPIGLEGPRLVLPPHSKKYSPGSITVNIGEPIVTEDLGISSRQQLTETTRQQIDRLRGPAGHVADVDPVEMEQTQPTVSTETAPEEEAPNDGSSRHDI